MLFRSVLGSIFMVQAVDSTSARAEATTIEDFDRAQDDLDQETMLANVGFGAAIGLGVLAATLLTVHLTSDDTAGLQWPVDSADVSSSAIQWRPLDPLTIRF